MPHDIMILNFHLAYFLVSNTALFLNSALVLSFYMDIVLTLSIRAYFKIGVNYVSVILLQIVIVPVRVLHVFDHQIVFPTISSQKNIHQVI